MTPILQCLESPQQSQSTTLPRLSDSSSPLHYNPFKKGPRQRKQTNRKTKNSGPAPRTLAQFFPFPTNNSLTNQPKITSFFHKKTKQNTPRHAAPSSPKTSITFDTSHHTLPSGETTRNNTQSPTNAKGKHTSNKHWHIPRL
jgi:hypothetical protein